MSTVNRFSMLDLSDSEGEQEAPARTQAPARSSSKASSSNKGGKRTTSKGAASSVIAEDPVAARKANTKQNARTYDRNAGTRKREFDRQSGTGRDRSIKKNGGGSRNWGKAGEGSETTAAPAEDKEGEAEVAPVVEEPDNSMTLEEYNAMMKEKKATTGAFKPLQARKVENTFGSKKSVQKKELPKQGSKASKRERDRNTKEKRAVEIGFTPPPVGGARPDSRSRDRDDRSARGGRFNGRGGRGGRGGGRGGRFNNAPRGNAVNLQDSAAFPSLG